MKKLFLICNAHIDPVWQWEWEEGAAETLSTFRTAARFCREFDGFIFNHNEAILYRWVEEYEPALFAEIQALVREGRWHIMSGWHLQPDCNMPSGEAMVRQIQAGQAYFREKFGAAPTTAINFDPFGHSAGLVQILRKSGYDSYLICRPAETLMHLDTPLFLWEGPDGSRIPVRRANESYNSALGHAVDKIRPILDATPEGTVNMVLWGVGDHGGGPSRADLAAIADLITEEKKKGNVLVHATPEEYFAAADKTDLPVLKRDLNPFAPGCYTTMARVKQKYRALENNLFLTEKMCAAATLAGLTYPGAELADAQADLLFAQFHDFLPGSSIRAAEEMAIRMLDHGLEILSRVRARAFFRLCAGQERAPEARIPILVYNPHPYPVEGDFTCEMMLWDQNWAEEFSLPTVYQDGAALPTQCEKEQSNLTLDWRKKVAFHATLPPMSMSRFDCGYHRERQKPVPDLPVEGDCYVFDNGRMRVRISRVTGLVEEYSVCGVSYLKENACRILVNRDDADPWGMMVRSFEENEGAFTLLTPEEAARYSGTDATLPAVRVIEGGPVRSTVEALFGYGDSRAVVRYTISRTDTVLDVSVRLLNNHPERMFKLCLETVFDAPALVGDTMYAEQPLATDGREVAAQRYVCLREGGKTFGVVNTGSYGLSAVDGALHLSLLRSAGYCAHPILDRPYLPNDRFSDHIDLGERDFAFRLFAGDGVCAGRVAQLFNQPPMALSVFPSGEGEKPKALLVCDSPVLEVSALKAAGDGDGFILRVYNPTDRPQAGVLSSPCYGCKTKITLGRYEVATFRLTAEGFAPQTLNEQACE